MNLTNFQLNELQRIYQQLQIEDLHKHKPLLDQPGTLEVHQHKDNKPNKHKPNKHNANQQTKPNTANQTKQTQPCE